jgi:hypothetical protein
MEAINQVLNAVAVLASGISIGMSIVLFLLVDRIAAIETLIRTSLAARAPVASLKPMSALSEDPGETVSDIGRKEVKVSDSSSKR